MISEAQAMTRRQLLGAAVMVPVMPGDLAPAPRTCWRCKAPIVGAGFQVATLEVEGHTTQIEWCVDCARHVHDDLLERVRASYGRRP
jgi:hypothetical protein